MHAALASNVLSCTLVVVFHEDALQAFGGQCYWE